MPATKTAKTHRKARGTRSAKAQSRTGKRRRPARGRVAAAASRKREPSRRAARRNGWGNGAWSTERFEALMVRQSPVVRDLTSRCMRLVLRTAPSAQLQLGEKGIGFKRRRPFCQVIPEQEGCRLTFNQGKHLFDPAGRLRGEPAEERFLWVSSLEHLDSYAVSMVQQAYAQHG